MSNDFSDDPFYEKYPAYQMGFVQSRHNALNLDFETILKSNKIEISKTSIRINGDKLFKAGLISKELHTDLNSINLARNQFVKSATKPNEREIRNLLNNVKCIDWKSQKRDKYSVYQLLLICIGKAQQDFQNSEPYREYTNKVFQIMKKQASRGKQ